MNERLLQPVEYMKVPDYPSASETVNFKLRLEDAMLLRAAVMWQRDYGMGLLAGRGEPGNETARWQREQLEANVGRYNDLLIRKF